VLLDNLVHITAKNIVYYDLVTSTDEYVNPSYALQKYPKSDSKSKCVLTNVGPHNRSAQWTTPLQPPLQNNSSIKTEWISTPRGRATWLSALHMLTSSTYNQYMDVSVNIMKLLFNVALKNTSIEIYFTSNGKQMQMLVQHLFLKCKMYSMQVKLIINLQTRFWGTMLQAERSRVWFPIRSLEFSINLILPFCI
jgi:hypothetical protein